MINGMTIQIKDVKPMVNDTLKGIRLKKEDKNYKKSKKFHKKNGFYYEETWNLDSSIAAFVLPRLIYFRDNFQGVPLDYCTYEEDGYTVTNMTEAVENWKKDIATMIEAFYYIIKDDYNDKKHKDIIKKGLKLFSKKFQNLWD